MSVTLKELRTYSAITRLDPMKRVSPLALILRFLPSSLNVILCLLWTFVHPRNEIFSEVCSILRGTPSSSIQLETVTGGSGAGSPAESTTTLSSLDCNKPPTMWNEATYSWPLLAPCGTVSMETDGKPRARKSRKRYAGAPCSWPPETLRTLGEHLRDSKTSTAASHLT
jgi:hypothetical protein